MGGEEKLGTSTSVYMGNEALEILERVCEKEKRNRSEVITLVLEKFLPKILSGKESIP